MTKEELDDQLQAVLRRVLGINDALEDAVKVIHDLIGKIQRIRAEASREPTK